VPQSVDERRRHVAEVAERAVRGIVDQDRDDLVVGLALVEEAEAADRARANEDRAVRDRTLGEDTDVERVAVADDARAARLAHRERRDAVPTPRLRDEAVRRRTDVREALRAVDLQMAARLVDLVLHGVGGNDLDERVHDRGRVGTDGDAVPRMRLEPRDHAAC
jgi:hypothetical protein